MIKRDKRSFIYNKRGKKKVFLEYFAYSSIHIQLHVIINRVNIKLNEIHIKLKFLTFLPFNKLSSFSLISNMFFVIQGNWSSLS